jgi:2'-5' RNA ligase
LFFALWPSPGWASPLLEAAASTIEMAGARAMHPSDLHVTLSFLGSVEESRLEALCSSAAALHAAAFALQFDRIELWRESRVLVAACSQIPPAGLALAQGLQLAACGLGLAPDRKSWRPHLTLARSVLPRYLPAELQAERPLTSPLAWSVSRFFLAESLISPQPRRYARLGGWPLR